MITELLWHDFLGSSGAALIVITYFLLQTNKLNPKTITYSLLNLIGASLILVSLYFNFNLSAVVIEIFWVAISLLGLFVAINNHQKNGG
tara:strand:+ start:97 stop:363 length:267 start_codon:yes stop_codon:yes gene_type:complete